MLLTKTALRGVESDQVLVGHVANRNILAEGIMVRRNRPVPIRHGTVRIRKRM